MVVYGLAVDNIGNAVLSSRKSSQYESIQCHSAWKYYRKRQIHICQYIIRKVLSGSTHPDSRSFKQALLLYIMARIAFLVPLLFCVFCFQVFAGESDVWSVSNIVIRPKAKQNINQSLTFNFNRKLSTVCAKSTVNTEGCLLSNDGTAVASKTRTCSGSIQGVNGWQICGRKGSTRFRVNADSFTQISPTRAVLAINVVRKEDIHQ
jgi:hypothetical protein